MTTRTGACIIGYLAAAVAANTLVSAYGPWALLITATVMIPLDLTTRDVLHEQWLDDHLWPRMAALVVAGSVLSFLTASRAVCWASMAAFAAASVTDALVYQRLHHRTASVKMNMSNIAAALVDSTVFPFIAFGLINPALTFSQASLKILGGICWTILFLPLYRQHRSRRA